MLADLKEILRYRELIVALAMREVRVRYKHALLGVGWALVMPLSLMLVFTYVFSRVASVQTGGVPYALFAYVGLVPWQLHANIINNGARSLSDNSNLVTKVYFPREVLPLSTVISALFDFGVASLLVVGLMVYFQVAPGPGLILLPLILGVQLCLGVALALLLSALNLLYRDVQFILQVGVTLWMFASSVVYPIPASGELAWLAWLNPMTPLLDAWRSAIIGGRLELPAPFFVAAGISFTLLLLSWRWFRRVEGVFGGTGLMDLLTRIKRRLKRSQIIKQHRDFEANPSQQELRRLLRESKAVLDLGCGSEPIDGAKVGVDLFVSDGHQRNDGPPIDVGALQRRGMEFVNQSIDSRLPFAEARFDFAYCSHVIEHVEHPGLACDEMMRVASRGLLRCPGPVMEYLIGRKFHRWVVLHRGLRLVFLEKTPDDFEVFGPNEADLASINPFEILLDWDGIRPSTTNRGPVGRLKRRLHDLVYKRMPQTEVNLFWEGGFFWTEIRADGSLSHGGRAGTAWWFDAAGKRHEARA